MNEQLAEFLKRQWPDADNITVENFEPIPGGYSRETFRFDARVRPARSRLNSNSLRPRALLAPGSADVCPTSTATRGGAALALATARQASMNGTENFMP